MDFSDFAALLDGARSLQRYDGFSSILDMYKTLNPQMDFSDIAALLGGGRSLQRYDGVSSMLDFYKTFTSAGKGLNLSTELLTGKYEKVSYPKETKTECVEESHVEKLTETRMVQVCETVVDDKAAKFNTYMGHTVSGIGKAAMWMGNDPLVAGTLMAAGFVQKKLGKLVRPKETIQYVYRPVEVTVNLVVTQKIRRTYEREIHGVWKILAGGQKVFEGYEYGPWKKAGEELLDRTVTKSV